MAIRFLARVPAVAAALAIVPLLVLVLRRGIDVPYWDEWEWADLVYAAHTHTLTFAQLWAPHNEHRILVSNVIMLALDAMGGWNVAREQIVSLLVLALTQLVVWLLIRRTVAHGRRGICFLVCTLLLLGLGQYENLEWGFQMAWFICDLGLAVAVWSLTVTRRGPGAVVLALVAATVASLSSSQGLVVWPAGLLAIVLVPRRWLPTAIAWCVVGLGVTAIVRAGSPGAAGPGHMGLSHAVVLAKYTTLYLGAPLTVSFGLPWALVAGALLIVALAALAYVAARGSLALRVRLAPWLALAAYPLLCAMLTSTARAGFGVEQALSSRYVSIGALAWVAVVAGIFVATPQRGGLAKAALAVAMAAVVFVSLKQTSYGNHLWRDHVAVLRSARAALADGNPGGLTLLYPDLSRLEMLLGKLAAAHDGIFSGP